MLIFLSLSCNLVHVMWYELHKNRTFCCVFQYHPVRRGNQHGSRGYDDLQNLLDMTSHESPLFLKMNLLGPIQMS